MSDGLLEAIERAIEGALERSLPRVVDRLAEIGGPRAYSVTQVAKRLHVSEPTVRKHIDSGDIQTVPFLKPARISSGALEAFLAGELTRPAFSVKAEKEAS
jgi:excisionase family DNA binding protein